MKKKTALTIAGSDCSGGAGIQADLKTMTMNGVYAMSAITALTAQNTTGVRGIQESTPDFLKQQLDAVFEDIYPYAVKIGMVASSELICVIADRLRHYGAKNVVVDPVMVATSGAALMKAFPDRVWRIIDGRTDLYGDGRIIALPTPGHTPGHQSLLVQMDNGSRVCLAADALYMDAALDDDREMRYTSPESIRILRALRGENVRIISGHDPGSFEGHCRYFRQHPAC